MSSSPDVSPGAIPDPADFLDPKSASLLAGKNFGIVTNIVSGPDGSLYVTSLSNGAVYMIK